MNKPQTVKEIRARIEQSETIQRLEQITIDSCNEMLKVLGETHEQKYKAIKPLIFEDFDTPKH